MMTITDLLQELEQEAGTTRRVLERVRENQLDWRPHEKSMTLGQLALHVATLPAAIAEVSTKPTFDVNTQIPRPSPTNTHELLAAFDQSVTGARAVLSSMDDSQLASPWKMVKGNQVVFAITRGALLRSVMLNHWYHHRGQLTVYLRQTGALVPAVYGASADENPMAA